MKKTAFAVPSYVFRTLSLPAGITGKLERVLTTHDGFYCRAVPLEGDADAIRSFIDQEGLNAPDMLMSQDDDLVYLIVTRSLHESAFAFTHEKKPDEEMAASENNALVEESAAEALLRLSDLTGKKCVMHFTLRKAVPPVQCADDEIHFVVGGRPPGETYEISRKSICGVRLDAKGFWVRSKGPVRGRGTIVKDSEETTAAQIIGRTVYLFVPEITLESAPFFTSEGADLLSKLVKLVSQTLVLHEVLQPEENFATTPEAYIDRQLSCVEDQIEELNEIIAESDNEAAEALERYRNALRRKQFHIFLREQFEAHYRATVTEHAAADWERIRAIPLVDSMNVTESALIVLTKPLIIEEDGGRYDLGQFTIQARFGKQVSVWTDAPTHPRGIPHPHISDRNAVCYGNAGPAIEDAILQYRIADAIELVCEWLVSGYDPSLAAVKIQEWPIYKEEACKQAA